MTRLTLTVFLLIFSKLLIAQTHEGGISGVVADGGDQKIIDAATVSLFKAKDSLLFKIGITDKAGNFLFEHLPFGKYYMLATSTGHLKT
jgi:iron complex outermembrane receptor protein